MEDEKLMGYSSDASENIDWSHVSSSTTGTGGAIQLMNHQIAPGINTYLYGGSVVYPGEPGAMRVTERTTQEILNEISSLKYSLKIIADRILEIETTELGIANVNEEKIERRKLIP